jgi:hypothetical protein
MSHNTVLINGMEQLAAKHGNSETYGRVIAFERGDGYVYWAGDATSAYGADTGLGRFIRHVVFVDDAYFVIFDDLAMADGQEPATFQWLYHTLPDVPLDFDADSFAIRYAMEDVPVVVRHLAHVDDLTYANRSSGEGMVNPITGEDVTQSDKWAANRPEIKRPKPQPANHIWISHETPRTQMQFLCVICPMRPRDEEPTIDPHGNMGVRVSFRGSEKTISFGAGEADIVVDFAAIREAAGR